MFPNATRKTSVACRGCGWCVDERDINWNDDLPPVPYCDDCYDDLMDKKGDDDELN